jgi:hypothetical protein
MKKLLVIPHALIKGICRARGGVAENYAYRYSRDPAGTANSYHAFQAGMVQ